MFINRSADDPTAGMRFGLLATELSAGPDLPLDQAKRYVELSETLANADSLCDWFLEGDNLTVASESEGNAIIPTSESAASTNEVIPTRRLREILPDHFSGRDAARDGR